MSSEYIIDLCLLELLSGIIIRIGLKKWMMKSVAVSVEYWMTLPFNNIVYVAGSIQSGTLTHSPNALAIVLRILPINNKLLMKLKANN